MRLDKIEKITKEFIFRPIAGITIDPISLADRKEILFRGYTSIKNNGQWVQNLTTPSKIKESELRSALRVLVNNLRNCYRGIK